MLSALGLFYHHLEDVLTQLTRCKHFTMVAGGRNCKSAEVEVYKCFDVKLCRWLRLPTSFRCRVGIDQGSSESNQMASM